MRPSGGKRDTQTVMDPRLKQLIEKTAAHVDAGERRAAIIALGYEQDPAVYFTLLEQLNDPAFSIQHAAIISLGRYGDPEAIKELIKPKILRSANVDVRWAAVEAIGKLGDYRVIGYLVRAAEDPAWIVRNQAVTEIKGIVRNITRQREKKSVHLLIRLLAMKDREIVELAEDGLCELGAISIDPLIEALKSISSRMRENAAETLGRMQIRVAVPPLIHLLWDPNPYVRRSAVAALGAIGDAQAIEPLIQCLMSDNAERVQKAAVNALVSFGSRCTIPLLNALAHEPNKFVIRSLLFTLGEVRDPAAIPSLVQQLGSSYFVIRNTAARALIRYGPQIIPALIPNLSTTRPEHGTKTLIRAAQHDGNLLSRIRAIRALGALEEHRAVPVLKRLSVSEEGLIAAEAERSLTAIGMAAWRRASTLLVLRELGDPQTLPHFLMALDDSSANVRLEAVRGLGRFGGKAAVAGLVRAAGSDPDPYVRAEALRFLREVGAGHSEILDLAFKALKDRDRTVRRHAAALLGLFHDDRSIAPLIKAMTDSHWGVREAAEASLLNLGHRAYPHLIQALTHRAWTVRFRAARLLGELGDPSARGALEQLIRRRGERREVREIAKEALLKLTAKAATPAS